MEKPLCDKCCHKVVCLYYTHTTIKCVHFKRACDCDANRDKPKEE